MPPQPSRRAGWRGPLQASAACVACGRRWPGPARFCAWCGGVIEPQQSVRPPVRRQRITVLLVVTLGSAIALSAGGQERLIGSSESTTAMLPAAPSLEVRVPSAQGVPEEQGRPPSRSAAVASCSGAPGDAPTCAVVGLRSGGSAAPPVLIDDRAVVLIEDDRVVRRELPRGDRSWSSSPFSAESPAALLAADGSIFVTAREAVVRLDPSSGVVMWRVRPDHAMAAAPAIRWFGDLLLVLDASGRLTALAPDDGRVRWTAPDASAQVLRVEPDGWTATRSRSPQQPDRGRVPRQPDGSLVWSGVGDEGLGSLVLTWAAVGDQLLATGLDLDGEVRWDAGPLPMPCCSIRPIDGARGLLTLAAPVDVGAVIDARTGAVLGVPRAEGRTLVGAGRYVGLWRGEDDLVGLRLSDGSEVFRADGQLAAVDPIIIQRGEELVHVALDVEADVRVPSRPLR